MEHYRMTGQMIEEYAYWLHGEEKSRATIGKYVHYLQEYLAYLQKGGGFDAEEESDAKHAGAVVTRENAVTYKEHLAYSRSVSTVNGMVAALNGFFSYRGWMIRLKPLRVQRRIFVKKGQELTRGEYQRLLRAARSRGQERLWLMLQTLGATGIRVSELPFITVQSLAVGQAEVDCKGKRRVILLPGQLCRKLKMYCRSHGITRGSVFRTRSGKNVDRSNLWREMKQLCVYAGVAEEKVSPHRLRHLFARCFYALERDIAKLADVLGHTNLSTTRIYIMTTSEEHEKQVARLGLMDCEEEDWCGAVRQGGLKS